jgi:predicted nucleic acid-binding protein
LKLYIDSSVLVKLYYPELESKVFAEWIKKQKKPIIFTHFHELEITNAFALKVFRNEISEESFIDLRDILEKDKAVGVLDVVSPDWSDVLLESIKISKRSSSAIGARSLDIIHVASADILNCDTFLTNDKRQFYAAQTIGINAITVENIPDYL